MQNSREPQVRKWVLIDLADKPLGRTATKIADILRGKHRAGYIPNADTGDFVVAINASKIKLTGTKLKDKMYYWHSRFMGGLREMNAEKLLQKHPEEIVMRAVKGMLPRNDLSRRVIKKLKVYANDVHPHTAQLSAKGGSAPG